MPDQHNPGDRVYTYRNGKRIYLEKEPDQFVVRARPEELATRGIIGDLERVSPSSTRVTISTENLDPAMDEIRNFAIAHHAYKQVETDSEFLITDRILVTFREPPGDDKLSGFMAKYALNLLSRYSEKEFLFQLTDQTNMNPVKLVVLINETETDLVESCEHDLNKRMTTYAVNTPTDAKYLQQWHLHTRMVNTAFDPRSSSRCEEAWNLLNHFGSADVVIGVTDDGCKLNHPDFDSPNKFAGWGYMTGNTLITRDAISADPNRMYQSGSDHGTSCCGVAAAEVDAVLTTGAAPGCRLLPIKWESSGSSLFISDSKMMTVLIYIADKIDILSNSWGSSPVFNFASNVITRISELAITGGRRGKGIVFLWAAGNENCPIKHSGTQNIPYDHGRDRFGNWIGVRTARVFEHNLVDVAGVMHIAALASNAQRSHYSNYGTGISVCAPSSNSHTYWRLAVTGLGIVTTTGESPLFDTGFGGTSSATPLVAGIAALVISANPKLNSLEVISVLQKTASKNLSFTPYPRTPAAPYDPNTSWDISPVAPHDTGVFNNINHADGSWSGWYGFGKTDAAAAVAEAIRLAGDNGEDENTIVKSSSPALFIPDNNPAGVRNTISVTEAGTLASLIVAVDITHTYIGDLLIRLISPNGTAITLHNRNGGSAKNINKIYDLQSTPQLSVLHGSAVTGNWILEITDKAPVDTGTLNKWSLTIGLKTNQPVFLEDLAGIVIPDKDPVGIERSLNSTSNGTVNDIEVGIDITHTYISDLIVNLASPKGTQVTLHSRTGGSADNIITTYTLSNHTNLQTLRGENIHGTWKLKISDVVGQDIGKLNKWSLKITGN